MKFGAAQQAININQMEASERSVRTYIHKRGSLIIIAVFLVDYRHKIIRNKLNDLPKRGELDYRLQHTQRIPARTSGQLQNYIYWGVKCLTDIYAGKNNLTTFIMIMTIIISVQRQFPVRLSSTSCVFIFSNNVRE